MELKKENLTAYKMKMESEALTEAAAVFYYISADVPCGKDYKWQQWSTTMASELIGMISVSCVYINTAFFSHDSICYMKLSITLTCLLKLPCIALGRVHVLMEVSDNK